MLASRIKELYRKQDCTVPHGYPLNKSPNQAQIRTNSSAAQEARSTEVKGKFNMPCVLSVSWGTQCTVHVQTLYLLMALDVSKLSSVFTIEFVLGIAPKPDNCAKHYHF